VIMCVPLSGDAWRCGPGEVVRAMSWRNFEMFNNLFQNCHDLFDEVVK